jgi:exopolysaccharide biosynthesis protein
MAFLFISLIQAFFATTHEKPIFVEKYSMAFRRSFFLVPLLPFLLALAPSLVAQLPTLEWIERPVAKGLIWKQIHTDALFSSRQNLNLLEVDPRKRTFSIAWSPDTLIATSTFASKSMSLSAVNAGFFDTKKGGSVTLLKVNGKVINRSNEKHVQDKSEILKGALIIGKGKKTRIEAAGPDSIYLRKKYQSVLLTGPLLLLNGEPVKLAKRAFNDNRHPRTCACITDAGKVLLLTADGRTDQAYGLSLPELTDLMQSLGCKDAVNLDGGGSTTMWVSGQPFNGIVNMPCDNKLFDHLGERKVANAVLIH